ncbi:unnamed protein product [Dracunculus medinensis]|uniref:G_PROTEIN_RECEP_F1_2 domain-containing protein n=1 Tax=Dracunculus medinensis TaxID=318479 RepID=A0A0N4U6U6_DRAME|nr:unnamed protein product [Dracunculus medinensis]
MSNITQLLLKDEQNFIDVAKLTFYASTTITLESAFALFINLYLLSCSHYLRKPIKMNLRLCINLTAANAACAFFYMISNLINVIIPTINGNNQIVSHCISLLVECLKISMFFASLFILLALAINHYVGIIYPFYRILLFLAYIVPILFFISLYSIMPGGFRNKEAFGFLTLKGCVGANIMSKFFVRLITVIPFILFVAIIVSLYIHIVIHMKKVISMGNFIHVMKLIIDAFIYASRLVEIRYSTWIFKIKLKSLLTGKRQNEDVLPNEFTKYVNETIENNENHRNIYTREANPLTGRKSFIGDIKEAPNCDF